VGVLWCLACLVIHSTGQARQCGTVLFPRVIALYPRKEGAGYLLSRPVTGVSLWLTPANRDRRDSKVRLPSRGNDIAAGQKVIYFLGK